MIPVFPATGQIRVAAVMLTLSVLATPALAKVFSPFDALLPGKLEGDYTPYVVKKGDTITWIAARHTVHPVRVYKPNAAALRDGLEYGEKLLIDTRRITPRFPAAMSGIVLNVPEAQVYVVKDGTLVHDYPVAVSQSDKQVPLGRTRVISKKKNPTWYVPKSIQKEMEEKGLEVKTEVPPGPTNPLGNRWIGFWDGSFGFHGTIAPTSIKRYASHGCVRFLKGDIEDLYDRARLGMTVYTLYQPVKLAVDGAAIWLEVYPDIYKQDYDYAGTVRLLAREAGVLGRLDWAVVDRALHLRDGIVEDAALPLTPTPRPLPTATPTPTATPVPTPTPNVGVPLPESDGVVMPDALSTEAF